MICRSACRTVYGAEHAAEVVKASMEDYRTLLEG
jgi:hypothetical protein